MRCSHSVGEGRKGRGLQNFLRTDLLKMSAIADTDRDLREVAVQTPDNHIDTVGAFIAVIAAGELRRILLWECRSA